MFVKRWILRPRYTDAGTRPIGRPIFLAFPAVGWLLIFGLFPLLFMVVVSFWTSNIYGTSAKLTLDNYARLIESGLYIKVMLKTLRIAFICTIITLIISFPIAYFLSQKEGRVKFLLIATLFLPFWISYVIRTFVWLPILGRNGLVNNTLMYLGAIKQPLEWLLYNEGTVYIGLVYVYTLFMTLPIYLSLEKIDPRLIEAAVDLGARPHSVLLRVLLPLSWPGILAGCLLVFLHCIGAFVTPQILGGPSGIMYGSVIASQFSAANNWAFGAALSVTLIVIVLLLLLVFSRWLGLREVFSGGRIK